VTGISRVINGALMTSDPNHWFVAQLKPNGLASAVRNLDRQGFASFSPVRMESVRVRNTRKDQARPLFPGYLFVQFEPHQQGWQSISSTRGVSRLILSDFRTPRPLPAAFMAGLIARCDVNGVLAPPEKLEPGDRIRVLSGPFADLITTVDQLDKGQRIQVLIDLMGRAVRTSLPRVAIERFDAPHQRTG